MYRNLLESNLESRRATDIEKYKRGTNNLFKTRSRLMINNKKNGQQLANLHNYWTGKSETHMMMAF